MALTNVVDVRVILPVHTALTDPQIQAAIDSASCIMEQLESELSATCQENIEKYLAAHFCCVTEFTLSLQSEKDACSGGSVVYGFDLGEGIMGSAFGQMANTLSGGELAEFDKISVAIHSIGSI